MNDFKIKQVHPFLRNVNKQYFDADNLYLHDVFGK